MGENLPSRIQYWLNEAKHDCFFVVGPEDGPTERIGALKTLLMGDSEPFRALLQDSQLAEENDIRLIDVEPETFWNFLKCVYGASNIIIPKLNFEQSAQLLYVVEKYLLNCVKSVLIDHMNDIFSSDDIFVALSYPVCYGELKLNEEIEDILNNCFKETTSDDRFLELSYPAIKWILQIECLLVKEVEIWKTVVRWAKHKTGSFDGRVLRSEMLGLLKYIRFLTMDYKEFSEHVVSSEILNEEEINDLCNAFVLRKPCVSDQLSNNKSSRFNTCPVSKHISSSLVEIPNFAYIHYSVSDVSKLQNNVIHYSETYCWANDFWSLFIFRCYEDDILSIFLQFDSNKFDVEVLSTESDRRASFNKILCRPKRGYQSLIKWSDLINPDSGFVKNDCFTFLVRIMLKEI